MSQKRWDWEGTASCPLNGSHRPPGLATAIICGIAANSKVFLSVYIHQSSHAAASVIVLRCQDQLLLRDNEQKLKRSDICPWPRLSKYFVVHI